MPESFKEVHIAHMKLHGDIETEYILYILARRQLVLHSYALLSVEFMCNCKRFFRQPLGCFSLLILNIYEQADFILSKRRLTK